MLKTTVELQGTLNDHYAYDDETSQEWKEVRFAFGIRCAGRLMRDSGIRMFRTRKPVDNWRRLPLQYCSKLAG